jgi:3-oxoacyl-[acyl-carrier-protein] synthase II
VSAAPDRAVAVTGVGAVTPAGIGAPQTWEAVCAGRSSCGLDPELSEAPVRLACRVPGFDGDRLLGAARAHRLDLFSQFALVAAHEALADAGHDPAGWDGARVGVVLGNAMGGTLTFEEQRLKLAAEGPGAVSPLTLPLMLPNMVAGQAAMEFGATGPCLVVTSACASGATAIGTARDLLLAGRCDIVLAGGSEASVSPLIVSAFAALGALSRREDDPSSASRPFDTDRDGFVLAEGAGVLVLERAADARARGARTRARIAGYGATADARHPTAPDPEGIGLAAAIRAALADAGAAPGDVGHLNAHGTGTPRGDAAEAAAFARALPHGPPVCSVKGVTGHTMAAAGAIEAVCTVLAVEQGLIPPTANLKRLDPALGLDVSPDPVRRRIDLALTNSNGFGGHNVVLAVAAP